MAQNITIRSELTDRQKWELSNDYSKSSGRLFQKFYIETKIFNTSSKVYSDCNAIIFINTGTTNVNVNDVIIAPSQKLTLSGNFAEIDTTQYQITFANPIDPNNQVTILRKLYA